MPSAPSHLGQLPVIPPARRWAPPYPQASPALFWAPTIHCRPGACAETHPTQSAAAHRRLLCRPGAGPQAHPTQQAAGSEGHCHSVSRLHAQQFSLSLRMPPCWPSAPAAAWAHPACLAQPPPSPAETKHASCQPAALFARQPATASQLTLPARCMLLLPCRDPATVCVANYPGCSTCGRCCKARVGRAAGRGGCQHPCTRAPRLGCCTGPRPDVAWLHLPLDVPLLSIAPAPTLIPSHPPVQLPAAKNAQGVWQCTVCKPYAPRDLSGYSDRSGNEINQPFCNGVCMFYKMQGTLLEVGGILIICAAAVSAVWCHQSATSSPALAECPRVKALR